VVQLVVDSLCYVVPWRLQGMITAKWTVYVAVRLSSPEVLHYLQRTSMQLVALLIVTECLPTLGIPALTLFDECRRFMSVVA